MPDVHAKLSASSAHRWMACTKSPALCEGIHERASPFAAEGTDAHTLCEYKVHKALGENPPDPRESLNYLDNEMEDCSDDYATYVMEAYEEQKAKHPDTLIKVEKRVDFSRWVPEAFGTADCLIISDEVLHVIDFKYGLGVLVEAENNPQMKCYALGAYDAFGSLYDFKEVKLTIFQPRRENISIWVTTVDELLDWAENELKSKALMAFNGEGDAVPGDHCRFCAARDVCRARAEYNLELGKYRLDLPNTLSDDEIAAILPRAEELVAWMNDVCEYALTKAISGHKFPGYKLVEGRSTRKYTDDDAVAKAVTDAGFDPYEKKLMGVTAMTKLLGKKKFDEVLYGLISKPAGKPTLVPEDDKRQEYNPINMAFDE